MLKAQGENEEAIGHHAGLSDTSLLLPVFGEAVRRDKLALGQAGDRSSVS